ncbi:MAG: PfkB family carbohydrate kinase [Sulfitobacter sp.]|nr:PfkB family carbohydrate kinase [Sulfitobacter sp.]
MAGQATKPADSPSILCIGSVLWDVIGRAETPMRQGSDMPGRITRLPGGVALNIGMALARFGLRPALISAVGRDPEGDELIEACAARGLETSLIYRSEDLPTDQYMAVEGSNGLIAAIADAHSLEAAGDKILRPLSDGSLPSPFTGAVALDGNLTLDLLNQMARSPLLAESDLRVAPASPGKALRLAPFIMARRGTLYVNLEEAGLLCQASFDRSDAAARGLLERGARRVVVTDGAGDTTLGSEEGLITRKPPKVTVARITGAGDTFMAAHIAAELRGEGSETALESALAAAALYVSGETEI